MERIHTFRENNHLTKNTWACFILFCLTLPHFKPGYLEQIPFAEMLINGGRLVSALVVLVWVLWVKKRVSLIVVLIGIQQGYILINTFLQGGAVRDCAITAASVVTVCLLYDLMQERRDMFLSSQLACFEVMVYINLASELVYPQGVYARISGLNIITKNWFWGYYNTYTQIAIPALLIAFLYMQKTGKKLRTCLLAAAILISALIAWSGGVLLSLFGMIAVYFLLKNRTKIFNYYSGWILQVWFFLFIICLKMHHLFRWLVDDVLKKWSSLNARIGLWDQTRKIIAQAWLYGYGQKTALERCLEVGKRWGSYAHNLLLELMYQGGMINIILFVIIIVMVGTQVFRHRNTGESELISVAFFGWGIASLVDAYMTPFLMAMFVIAYYSNREFESVPCVRLKPGRTIRLAADSDCNYIKVSVAVALAGIICIIAEKSFAPSWNGEPAIFTDDDKRYEYFSELPRNTLDYIIVGDNQPDKGINPAVIYAKTGITGYSLGSKGQSFAEAYGRLTEALESQSPAYVFWDAESLSAEADDMTLKQEMEEIHTFCSDHEIRPVFVICSDPNSSEAENRCDRLFKSDNGIELLNLADGTSVGIDWSYDADDAGLNLNDCGVTKTSLYLAEWLSGQEGVEDHRGIRKYVFWDQLLDGYRDWEETMFLEQRGNTDEQVAEMLSGEEAEPALEREIYLIAPADSEDCVCDVAGGKKTDGSNIQLWTRNNGWPQDFSFIDEGNGIYTIYIPGSNRYVGIENAGSSPASNVVQQDYTGLAYQKWILVKDSENRYNLVSLYNGFYLDVEHGDNKPGTNIQVWKRNGDSPQLFMLEKKLGDGRRHE